MKSGTRRVPRKIGGDLDDIEHGSGIEATKARRGYDVVVKRPPRISSSASKHKRSAPAGLLASLETEDEREAVMERLRPTQRPSDLAAQRELSPSAALPFRAGYLNNGPIYDAKYLNELKNSTTPAPRGLDRAESVSNASPHNPHLDIASKFGEAAVMLDFQTQNEEVRIPTEHEIREKKERRRRLAKESNYISLSGDSIDDEELHSEDSSRAEPQSHSLIIHVDEAEIPSKYPEGRIVQEDEDIAEGFDAFVEDPGKVALGSEAAKEQQRQRKRDIEEQIQSAQHHIGSVTDHGRFEENYSEDEEDLSQNAAYEAAQIRAGAYGISSNVQKEVDKESRLKKKLEFPTIKPPSDFGSVVLRLFDVLASKEQTIKATKMRLEKLESERVEIGGDEARIKELLEEAAEKYSSLKHDSVVRSVEAISQNDGRDLTLHSATDASKDSAKSALHPNLSTHTTQRGFDSDLRGAPSGMAGLPSEEAEYSD